MIFLDSVFGYKKSLITDDVSGPHNLHHKYSKISDGSSSSSLTSSKVKRQMNIFLLIIYS